MMAYNANLSVGEMRYADHAIKVATTYTDLMANLHLKEDWTEVFFSKWPQSTLPADYLIWAEKKAATGPKTTGTAKEKDDALNAWIKKEAKKYDTATTTKDTKLKVFFGVGLIETAVKACGFIKQHLNRYNL